MSKNATKKLENGKWKMAIPSRRPISSFQFPVSNAGFTLVEMLLAVLVLVIGIVSVAKLVPLSVASNLRNRNDTTSLVAAQAMLEQMMNPCEWTTFWCPSCQCSPLRPNFDITVGGTGGPNTSLGCLNPSPANTWAFCDAPQGNDPAGNHYGILLGSSNLTANSTTVDGCPLVTVGGSQLGQIDWTQPASACNGYTQTEINPVTGVQIEYRWNVIQMSDANGNPYRKVLIVSARQVGTATFSNVVGNVVGVMGKK